MVLTRRVIKMEETKEVKKEEWLIPESEMLKGAINDMRSKIVFFRVDLIGIRRHLLLVPTEATLARLQAQEKETLDGIKQTEQIIKNLRTELDRVLAEEAKNATIK